MQVEAQATNSNINIIFDTRKYYNDAHNYCRTLILIAEEKPYPPFYVLLSDLSLGLKKELDKSLDSRELQCVVKQALLRIYNDIDTQYNQMLPDDDPDFETTGNCRSPLSMEKRMEKILRVELVK